MDNLPVIAIACQVRAFLRGAIAVDRGFSEFEPGVLFDGGREYVQGVVAFCLGMGVDGASICSNACFFGENRFVNAVDFFAF